MLQARCPPGNALYIIVDNRTNIPNFTDSASHLYYPYCSERHLRLP
ncbi:hypothetical protein AAFW49_001974 [Salmonella enterica]